MYNVAKLQARTRTGNSRNQGYFTYPASSSFCAKSSISNNLPRQYEVMANCYGILSDYAIAEKNYTHAENLLLSAIEALQKNPVPYNRTIAQVMLSLSSIAEKKGNLSEALRYYKQYIDLHKQVYDAEQMATGKRLEAQYQAEKKNRRWQRCSKKLPSANSSTAFISF